MELVGGRLLSNMPGAVDQHEKTGMMVGQIAPVSGTARFNAAMQFADAQQANALKPTPVAATTRVAQVFAPTAPTANTGVPAATSPASAATGQSAPAAPKPIAASTVDPANAADAQERARRTLDLSRTEPSTPSAATDGDRILDGLTRLRGVFDAQQGKLINAMNQPITDANSMIGLQVEVINFSMLVDVSSKLTGKSTGALETLMKGQ